jgi:hypothetical protein
LRPSDSQCPGLSMDPNTLPVAVSTRMIRPANASHDRFVRHTRTGQRDTREKEPLNPILGLFDDSPIHGSRQEGLGLPIEPPRPAGATPPCGGHPALRGPPRPAGAAPPEKPKTGKPLFFSAIFINTSKTAPGRKAGTRGTKG